MRWLDQSSDAGLAAPLSRRSGVMETGNLTRQMMSYQLSALQGIDNSQAQQCSIPLNHLLPIYNFLR